MGLRGPSPWQLHCMNHACTVPLSPLLASLLLAPHRRTVKEGSIWRRDRRKAPGRHRAENRCPINGKTIMVSAPGGLLPETRSYTLLGRGCSQTPNWRRLAGHNLLLRSLDKYSPLEVYSSPRGTHTTWPGGSLSPTEPVTSPARCHGAAPCLSWGNCFLLL